MIESALISPQGRMSIEKQVLQDQFNVYRLMCCSSCWNAACFVPDRRPESTYYELSHHSLVQPILKSHRTRAIALTFLAGVGGYGAKVLVWVCRQ